VRAGSITMPRDHLTVLVVEPDDGHRRSLTRYLASGGFRVLDTTAAEDALFQCGEHLVHLVLAAQNLPGFTGADLCRLLRERGGPPVVLIADGESASSRAVYLDDGVDACIDRPVAPAAVMAHIRAVLRRRGRR
jgi:DNA-binding response OmpR family regulator